MGLWLYLLLGELSTSSPLLMIFLAFFGYASLSISMRILESFMNSNILWIIRKRDQVSKNSCKGEYIGNEFLECRISEFEFISILLLLKKLWNVYETTNVLSGHSIHHLGQMKRAKPG